MIKNAEISKCGKYRYLLERTWDESKEKVLFIMLNPSTADANNDDPTIRRCISFAKSWGYGGLMVGNLFALRATNPKELIKYEFCDDFNPQYPDYVNEKYIAYMSEICEKVILAYGNPPIKKWSKPGFKNSFHLGLTKLGNPKHPLYLKSESKPIEFNQK